MIEELSSFIGISAVGCKIFSSSFLRSLNINKTLITFNPPPVEPAHAPIKLIVMSVDTINVGQTSYAVLVKPDVVINDTV